MPWGDYGNTLLVGYAFHNDDQTQILVERTGPFVPPVYNWGRMLLISDSLKQVLETTDLKGFIFQKTVFKKIVNIDWTNWDLNAADPKSYPAGGEPENYILGRKHHPETADLMEAIWCLELDDQTLTGRQKDTSGKTNLFLIENSWTGNDIFITKGAGYVYFSEKAKTWFEANGNGFANFEPFQSKVATPEEIEIANEYIKPIPQKVDPFAHLTPKDWKTYQKLIAQANKFIVKSKSDQTEKAKLLSLKKAIESFKSAQQIRPLGKKEQQQLDQLSAASG